MKFSSTHIDKTAVGISLACAAHCLLLPALLTLAPSITATAFASEDFHLWLLLAVIPTSLIALTIGCRKHGEKSVIYYGIIGIGLMCLAVILGHDLLGENGEKSLTLLGALIIALGHLRNYKLCRKSDCACD